MKLNLSSETNPAASARAFATYALVPYLGILFCPGALLMGSVGIVKSYRLTDNGGAIDRSAGMVWISVAIVELVAQIMLWWLLYKVPEWNQVL